MVRQLNEHKTHNKSGELMTMATLKDTGHTTGHPLCHRAAQRRLALH